MSEKTFSPTRKIFWPVHNHELPKLLSSMALFFLMALIFHVLKDAKDPLVVNATGAGASIIPFLKLWVLLPGAIIAASIFSKLSNYVSRENLFYVMVTLFCSFFVLFAFFLYPNREAIHLNTIGDALEAFLPPGAAGFAAIIRFWSFSIYYVVAELWGAVLLSLLLWGFINEITSMKQAKRFYGILGMGINLSGVAAGFVVYRLSGLARTLSAENGMDLWQQTLMLTTIFVCVASVVMMFLFRFLNTTIIPREIAAGKLEPRAPREKLKMSLRENIKTAFQSKYFLCLAGLVFFYNMLINLTEVVWKDRLHHYFPATNDLFEFMGQVSFFTGFVSCLMSYLLTGNLLRKFGWKVTAMLTPMILLVTSLIFFPGAMFGHHFDAFFISSFGINTALMVIYLGAAQNILSRSSKYSVFDATKEMAFLPIPKVTRIKLKVAVDGIGSRFGKSGSAFFYQILLMVFGSVAASTPAVAVIVLGALCFWIGAVRYLGTKVED